MWFLAVSKCYICILYLYLLTAAEYSTQYRVKKMLKISNTVVKAMDGQITLATTPPVTTIIRQCSD